MEKIILDVDTGVDDFFSIILANKLKKIFENKIIYADNIEQALTDADLCFIFTDWKVLKT